MSKFTPKSFIGNGPTWKFKSKFNHYVFKLDRFGVKGKNFTIIKCSNLKSFIGLALGPNVT